MNQIYQPHSTPQISLVKVSSIFKLSEVQKVQTEGYIRWKIHETYNPY